MTNEKKLICVIIYLAKSAAYALVSLRKEY